MNWLMFTHLWMVYSFKNTVFSRLQSLYNCIILTRFSFIGFLIQFESLRPVKNVISMFVLRSGCTMTWSCHGHHHKRLLTLPTSVRFYSRRLITGVTFHLVFLIVSIEASPIGRQCTHTQSLEWDWPLAFACLLFYSVYLKYRSVFSLWLA